jgi:hypothetical protein
MPLAALCANLSWELIFSVVRPDDGAQLVVNMVWLALDLGIAYTVLRYGPREFPGVPRPTFYGGFAVTLGFAYLGVDLVSRTFDGGHASYAAFGQNLMMSALFLAMLAARYGRAVRADGALDRGAALAGQSVWIAGAKLTGTGLASLASWLDGSHDRAPIMIYLYLGTALLDLAYLVAVLAVARRAAPHGTAIAGPDAGAVAGQRSRMTSAP